MKKILVNENDIREMTEGEVVEKWMPLVRKLANRWSYTTEYDDLFQEGMIALLKAYRRYNMDKYPVGFGVFAKKYINTEIMNYNKQQIHYRMQKNKTWKVQQVVSLNQNVGLYKDEDLIDLIEDDRDFEDGIIIKDTLKNLLNNLTDNQKTAIVLYHLEGYTQPEIADMKGTLSRNISNWVSRARRNMKKDYIENFA